MKHTNKYAIVVGKMGGEFYPDPEYTDIARLDKKLKYLADYQEKNSRYLTKTIYIAELLTPARLEQHQTEWNKWRAMID